VSHPAAHSRRRGAGVETGERVERSKAVMAGRAGVVAARKGEFAVTGEEATLHAAAVTSAPATVGAGGLILGRWFLVLDQASLQLTSDLLADLFNGLFDLGEGLGAGRQVGVEKEAQSGEDFLADAVMLGLGHGNSPA
jgi:hypothetical protein